MDLNLMAKVAGVKVYLRQTWNFKSHAESACSNYVIGLWHHRLMHGLTACITPWHRRPILHGLCCKHCPMTSQANTAWALLFWFCLRYTFTPATLLNGNILNIDVHGIDHTHLLCFKVWAWPVLPWTCWCQRSSRCCWSWCPHSGQSKSRPGRNVIKLFTSVIYEC